MSITVYDILQLDLLKDAQLIAGKKGMSREVMRVNFTDSPLNPRDPGYHLVSMGDLYIHSFYTEKADEDRIYDLVSFYIQSGSCCCVGVKYDLLTLPDRVIRLANQANYPIIMADSEISYGQLIKDISELILTEQLDLHSENKINRLLYDKLTSAEQNELARYLIPNLPGRFYCLHITFQELSILRFKLLKQELETRCQLHFLRYQRGGFLILEAQEGSVFSPGADTLMRLFESYGKISGAGVSSCYTGTDQLAACFKEAVSAHEISRLTKNKLTWHDDISVYSLLLPLRDQAPLQKFVRDTLSPLVEYGNQHSIDITNTVRIYLETNGNYRETAVRMNTHENTIRFRISKAKALLGLEQEAYIFIERLSLALKAERMLTEQQDRAD